MSMGDPLGCKRVAVPLWSSAALYFIIAVFNKSRKLR
jgi:hypothetical protein